MNLTYNEAKFISDAILGLIITGCLVYLVKVLFIDKD